MRNRRLIAYGHQQHCEHLHPRAGRDAEEGDGEHGRGVWEQGEVRLLRRIRANARFFRFWDVAERVEVWYNIGKVKDLNKN